MAICSPIFRRWSKPGSENGIEKVGTGAESHWLDIGSEVTQMIWNALLQGWPGVMKSCIFTG
ncbi:hypothetical protein BOW51_03925 [Solemya velesiana gill symbiont]|uniref:Uncharacterized protein n=1 Tax=Solemya velesiana gill symbiont TaxID=1918948 RepID=A0A1T2KWA6_9GAMM|nr:hypothetical protein BOW51_03925 [Solemya velesiana gill symbiont]